MGVEMSSRCEFPLPVFLGEKLKNLIKTHDPELEIHHPEQLKTFSHGRLSSFDSVKSHHHRKTTSNSQ